MDAKVRETHAHFQLGANARLAAAFSQSALETALGNHGFASSVRVTRGDTAQEQRAALETAEILVLPSAADLRGIAEIAPRLRWIHCTSAGIDNLTIDRLPEGAVLTNSRGVHTERAGEFSIAALLMLNNAIPEFATAQAARSWRPRAIEPIAGKLVVILGTGVLGEAAADKARLFGMRTIGVNRSGKANAAFDAMAPLCGLKDALREADYLLITLPATAETAGLVDRATLDCLPARAGVINIGRGPVLDADALAQKLTEGTLRNAVLDVLPQEPLPEDSPLWATPNLFITPHSGLFDVHYGERCLAMFAENLQRYLRGEPVFNQVDLARGY